MRRTECVSNAEPVVREFFEIQHGSEIGYQEHSERAGINHDCLHRWKRGCCPTVALLNAALGAHGYELAVVKIKKNEKAA